MAEILKDATSKGAHGADFALTEKVHGIISDIENRGEAAVRELSSQFDNWEPEQFRLTPEQIETAVASVAPETLADIKFAQTQIRGFAQAQLDSMLPVESAASALAFNADGEEASGFSAPGHRPLSPVVMSPTPALSPACEQRDANTSAEGGPSSVEAPNSAAISRAVGWSKMSVLGSSTAESEAATTL